MRAVDDSVLPAEACLGHARVMLVLGPWRCGPCSGAMTCKHLSSWWAEKVSGPAGDRTCSSALLQAWSLPRMRRRCSRRARCTPRACAALGAGPHPCSASFSHLQAQRRTVTRAAATTSCCSSQGAVFSGGWACDAAGNTHCTDRAKHRVCLTTPALPFLIQHAVLPMWLHFACTWSKESKAVGIMGEAGRCRSSSGWPCRLHGRRPWTGACCLDAVARRALAWFEKLVHPVKYVSFAHNHCAWTARERAR